MIKHVVNEQIVSVYSNMDKSPNYDFELKKRMFKLKRLT